MTTNKILSRKWPEMVQICQFFVQNDRFEPFWPISSLYPILHTLYLKIVWLARVKRSSATNSYNFKARIYKMLMIFIFDCFPFSIFLFYVVCKIHVLFTNFRMQSKIKTPEL